jgi:hypothetical protein
MDKLIMLAGGLAGLGVTWFVFKAFWKAWTYAPFINPDGEKETRRSFRRARRERRRRARIERRTTAVLADVDHEVETTGDDGFKSRYGDWEGSPTGRLRRPTPPVQDLPW